MPKELPGFYFDVEKNRYFPSSSKPNGKARSSRPRLQEVRATNHQHTPKPLSSPKSLSRTCHRSPSVWQAMQWSRLAKHQRERIAATHQVMSAQFADTRAYQAIPVPVHPGQTLTAFAAGAYDGKVWSLAGDNYGAIHAFDPSPISDFLSVPEHTFQHSWSRAYQLDSHISSICFSYSRWVATSFSSSILIHDLPSNRTVRLSPSPHLACDIWTSDLRNRSLVLGVRQHALLMQDLESLRDARRLETQSDVFALHQEEGLVYTGSRNGSIRRFDTRTRAPGPTLLSEEFTKSSNSITYLNVIKDWQLLVSTIRGTIEIFDVRYPQGSHPLLALLGHVNSYQPKLPHAITPSQGHFFAAGLDGRIRGWSLLTGEPLSYSSTSPLSIMEIPGHQKHAVDTPTSPFAVMFEELITSLEITQVRHELCLFATSGSGLHRFILGRP
ncbi:WD40-repeat-containing domain protein [Lactarius vividus]|nr:WD40-repeat-containing domain protein [Lactarius vividus]